MFTRLRDWLQRWRILNTGSGAIAQSHQSIATGAQGVSVQGSVDHSIVITGDHTIVQTNPASRATSVLLTAYGQMLVAQCQHLPLRGVDIQHSDPQASQRRLELAQVYIVPCKPPLRSRVPTPWTARRVRARRSACGRKSVSP